MLIYSIISPENIFYEYDNSTKYSYAKYKGVTLQLIKNENNSIVDRIISTNPNDYLISNLQPGFNIDNRELEFLD